MPDRLHPCLETEVPLDDAERGTDAGQGVIQDLEERLALLEGGQACVVAASGMAAMSGAFLALLKTGDHVIISKPVYVAVDALFAQHLSSRYGIETTFVDTTNPENVGRAITARTQLVHVETPTNPTTFVSDIAEIAGITQAAGALLMVDSTWSGLVTQRPLQLGADLVAHSLSKYVNGHADAIGGAIIGSSALIKPIRGFTLGNLGACISPFNAAQILRGSVTLPLRMAIHCRNAAKVATFLEAHPKVAWVRYPGLPSHPQHQIAVRQMQGFSGMLNFDIRADRRRLPELTKRLRVFVHATCFGHDHSLIMVYRFGKQFFYRVSVGLEDADDLIADLDQALDAL